MNPRTAWQRQQTINLDRLFIQDISCFSQGHILKTADYKMETEMKKKKKIAGIFN